MIRSERIPERYRIPLETEDGGDLLEFRYSHGGTEKRALVYRPAAAKNCGERKFPAVYLFHGGGDSEESFFGSPAKSPAERTPLVPMLDRMIAEGILAPCFVVTPTYYGSDPGNARVHAGDAAKLTGEFWRELNSSLIPAVDAAFPTVRDRDFRAAGGFSMGAEATWNVLAKGAETVRYYLPMSGDFWAVEVKGGATHPAETSDALIDGIKKQGLGPGDYEIFAATGTGDIAWDAMSAMVNELLGRRPWFSPSEDGGNLSWCVSEGWHAYEWCWDYIAAALPKFFPAGK